MGPWQNRLVFGALVVSESTWVFVVLGAVGAASDRGGSPLGWPAILMIMGASLVLGRLGRINYTSVDVTNIARAVLGVTTVYLAVGAHLSTSAGGVDLGWVARVFSDAAPEGFTFGALAGVAVGSLLWWRAGALGAVEFPTDALGFSFRVGIVGFAVATLIDVAHPADLQTFPMIFVFFAFGLLGLSIGHLLSESERSAQQKMWHKVIGGLVSSVLLVGLVFGLLQRTVLDAVSSPLLALAGSAVQAVIWVLFVPLAFLLNLFFNLLISFFGRLKERFERGEVPPAPEGETRTEPVELPEETLEELPPLFTFVIQIVEWVFVALVLLLLLYLLTKVLRRVYYRLLREPSGTRESVSDEADPMMDIARLLLKLVPHWARRRRRGARFTIPDGPEGVVDVLRIYYDLLNIAEKYGVRRLPHETPTEFQESLVTIFPQDLVSLATDSFNRALYGYYPASADQISLMRSTVKGLASGPA